MIEVEIPGHGIAEFPDGTPDDVMKNALKRYIVKQGAQQAPQSQEQKQGGFKSMPSSWLPQRGEHDNAAGLPAKVADALTLGFGDEIVGNLSAAGTRAKNLFRENDVSPQKAYDDERQRYGQTLGRFEKENPVASTALDVLGTVGTTAATGGFGTEAALAKFAPQAGKILPRIGQIAAESGIGSGIQYLGDAEDPNLSGFLKATGLGTAWGAGGGAVTKTAGKYLREPAEAALSKLKEMPLLTTGQALGNRVITGAEDLMRQIPVLGRPLQKRSENASKAIADQLGKVFGGGAESLSSKGLTTARKETGKAYEDLTKKLPEGSKTLTTTENSLDFLQNSGIKDDLLDDEIPVLNLFQKKLSKPNLTVKNLEEIRSDIYKRSEEAMRAGKNTLADSLRNLRAKATDDYEQTYLRNVGEQGIPELKNAQSLKINEMRLDKTIGSGINREGDFDPQIFAGNFSKKYDEKALNKIYGQENIDEIQKSVDYAKAAKARPYNPSGSGAALILKDAAAKLLPSLGLAGTAYTAGYDPATSIAAGALPYAGSKILASPKMTLRAMQGLGGAIDNPVVDMLAKSLARQQGRKGAIVQNEADKQKALSRALINVGAQ